MTAGSGVIIDAKKGHVLTSHHVVGTAKRLSVTVKDGRQFKAKLLGSDGATDIALLESEPADLTDVPWGTLHRRQIGHLLNKYLEVFGIHDIPPPRAPRS